MHRQTDALAGAAADGPDEMGRELAAGPMAVSATLYEIERLRPALDDLLAPAQRIVLTGTGASLAVARVVAPLWREQLAGRAGLLVRQSTEAALGDLDGHRVNGSDLVVAISQSGTSPETLAAAAQASARGASALAVTAHPEAPLARAATLVLPIASGEEQGASTKSALATLAGLLALARILPSDEATNHAVTQRLQAVVAAWSEITPAGRSLADADQVWFVGFGAGLGVAEAGALIWHEKVVRQASAMTPSEFRHGPIESATAGDSVVLVELGEADGRRAGYLERLRSELIELDVTLVEVTPQGGPIAEQALVALLRVQQLARAAALAAGTYRDGFAVLRRIVTAAGDLFG